jgi:hypothetical protein
MHRQDKHNNRQTSLCSRMNGYSDSSINTTSSSSSNEDELPAPPLNAYQYQCLFGTVTRAPKIQYHHIDWQRHVDEKIANGTFSRYYWMNLQSFKKLVRLLEIPINYRQSLRSTSANLPIEDHIYVSTGLRFLAGIMTADIATIYGMLEQSTDRVIDVILDNVLACEALHIKIPTGDGLRRVARFHSVEHKRMKSTSAHTTLTFCRYGFGSRLHLAA